MCGSCSKIFIAVIVPGALRCPCVHWHSRRLPLGRVLPSGPAAKRVPASFLHTNFRMALSAIFILYCLSLVLQPLFSPYLAGCFSPCIVWKGWPRLEQLAALGEG